MTASLESFGRTLVIAPHPDDEILGAGATMARLAAAGIDVYVAVVTTGRAPHYSDDQVSAVRQEAARAHAHIGVHETFWLDQPAAGLWETPHSVLNAAVQAVVRHIAPTTVLLPFVGDIHIDHQLCFLAGMVAARPHQEIYPPRILAYETLSETNWHAPYLTPAFVPNVFVQVDDTIQIKLEAFRMFQSQVKAAPHERSPEAIAALATLRGATVHCTAAEAFVLVRDVVRY